jgi:lysophospholipase L1-like esterase
MASDPARTRRAAILAGVVVAAVVAVLVLLGNGREPAVRAAATQRSAAEATSTAPGRGASGAASPSDGTGTPAETTSPAPTAGRTTTEPPAAGATAGPTPRVLAGNAPPDGDGRPSVTFIGDSWAVGVGATGQRGYAVLTGEQLGWTYDVLGVSGSGYTQGGAAGITFGQRIDAAVATDADVIVVQGSLNERNSTPSALAAAARTTLERLRREADPHTKVLVVGSTYAPGTPDGTIDWINDAIAGAATQVGLSFIDPTAEHWIDATDPTLWFDVNHPDDAGYRLVADHLARELRVTLVR